MSGHICQVITNLTAAGAEQYVVQLSNYAHSQGQRVSIVAGVPHTIAERVTPGIHIESIQMHPGVNKSLILYLKILVPAVRQLVNYFRREKVTVVHSHLMASALPAWIAARICGIPVIHSKMHSLEIVSSYQNAIFKLRLHLALVQRYLVFTQHSVEEARDVWQVPDNRIVVSSIGVDVERFGPSTSQRKLVRDTLGLSDTDQVLLSVARLHPDKDVRLAVAAALRLDDPGVHLLIAGDGEERAALLDLVATTPSETHVHFLGLVRDLPPIYAASDILLQTTRSPDMGTAVLEAMASAVPVIIAYRDDEERRMAQHTLNGLEIGTISKATPEEMAKELTTMLSAPSQLKILGANARVHAVHSHAKSAAYDRILLAYTQMERQ